MCSLGLLGTKSILYSWSGFSKLIVAGARLFLIDKILNIASTLPAAPNKWPIDDFVELTFTLLLLLNN